MWEKTKAVSRDGLNDGDGEPQNGSSEHVAYFNKKAKKKKKNRDLVLWDKLLYLLPQGNYKLEITWQGPFSVVEKIPCTN